MGPWGMAGTGARTSLISPFCHNDLLLYFSRGNLNHQWAQGAPAPSSCLDLPGSPRKFFLIAREVEGKGTQPPSRGNVGSVSGEAGKGDGNLISTEENTNPFMWKGNENLLDDSRETIQPSLPDSHFVIKTLGQLWRGEFQGCGHSLSLLAAASARGWGIPGVSPASPGMTQHFPGSLGISWHIPAHPSISGCLMSHHVPDSPCRS